MADTKELNAREETIRTTTCEPSLLTEFAEELKRSLKKIGLPAEVFLNRVYKGGYIGEHYNTRRHHEEMNTSQPVESFQFEYDTRLTHDQETLEPDNDAMDRLRRAVEQALRKTYVNLLSHNVGDVSGNIPTNLQKKLNS